MATISAPTLLATFQTSHASSSKDRHVTLAPVHGSEGELAVAAVQGDGVWTYDLRTLRPTTSYTVPPSTAFTTRPLSYLPPKTSVAAPAKGKGKAVPQDEDAEMDSSADSAEEVESGPRRTTMVGMKTAGKGQEAGEIWCWRGEDDERTTIPTEYALQDLHHLNSPRYSVLAVATNGHLYLLDTSDHLHPLSSTIKTSEIVASKTLSTSGASCGLVAVGIDGRIWSIRVDYPVEGSTSVRLTSETKIGEEGSTIRNVAIGEDGAVTAIDSNNHLLSINIREAKEVKSTQIPYLGVTPALTSVPSAKSLLLHFVSTSLLLSTPEPDSPVVLAASDLFSVTTDGEFSQIHLVGKASTSTWTVAFVVWHKHSDKDSGRSVVYTCELTLPEKGFGMNLLLGSHKRTALYLPTPKEGEEGWVKPIQTNAPEEQDLLELLEGPIKTRKWEPIRRSMERNKTLKSSTFAAILKKAISTGHVNIIYGDFLSLPPPAIDFRLELRKAISAEEATHLLAQLVEWSEIWVQHRTEGLGWPDSTSTISIETASLPTLESILLHSSLLLDSHLPLLVEYGPAAGFLEALSATLVPLLALQSEIRQLRAPVDALLTLSKREERRRADLIAKKDTLKIMSTQPTGGRNNQHNRKKIGAPRPGQSAALHDQDFGKWKVEDFVF